MHQLTEIERHVTSGPVDVIILGLSTVIRLLERWFTRSLFFDKVYAYHCSRTGKQITFDLSPNVRHCCLR